MSIVIGIDTGGTYTDAVLLDTEKNMVLGQGKALTTHDDLKCGILAALNQLDPALCAQAELAGLSTTLATNACVEGKFRRSRLLLMGIDWTGICRYGADYGFTNPDDLSYLPCRTTVTGQILEEPDWAFLRKNAKAWFREAEGCAVCELYGVRNGGILEKKAAEILREETGLPVVCASSLFSGLSSLERGASALLNVGLLPIMAEFLEAVKIAFAERNIRAELFLMRSDGSLMGLAYAREHTVETLLSGPAASALGGSRLSGAKRAVVVDMGGTTTDIALIQNGVPLQSENGLRVGGWRTQVRGVRAASFAIGGDSVIRWEQDGSVRLGPERVVPLCVLAQKYPNILLELQQQLRETPGHSLPLHEFLLLCRSDWRRLSLSESEQKLCLALESGPLRLQQAADIIEADKYHFSTKTLETIGVVMRAGLTPTDIMHLRGDYTAYQTEASRLGGRFVAASMGITLKTLCDLIYETVSQKMFFGIACALLEEVDPYFQEHGTDESIQKLLQLQWDRRGRRDDTLLGGFLQTDVILVGVGGPTHLFLPLAAQALGTQWLIPQYASVANAIGAVIGGLRVSAVAEVRLHGGTTEGTAELYEVLCEGETPRCFRSEQEALQWSREALHTLTTQRLRLRGGVGEQTYTLKTEELTVPLGTSRLKLGTRLQMTASTNLSKTKGGTWDG